MKMKKSLVYITLLFLGGILILNGCKKDKTTEEVKDTDTQTASDNSLAEGTFNDVNNIANQAVENGTLSTYRQGNDPANILSSCATITPHDTSGHGRVDIDFGSTPCLCNDLRYRQGIVYVSYSGRYRDSTTVITVSFNNYYVGQSQTNMYKVMGTKRVTNLGHNSAGHEVFSVTVNGTLLNTAGQTMSWNSSRYREWIAGESTVGNWADDEYKITGSVNGTGFAGNSYTLTITQALHIALNCRWIEDGKFEFTPNGRATRYVDYGTGACDAQATVTINGYSFNITLP